MCKKYELEEEVCEWCGCYLSLCECEDMYNGYVDDMDVYDWCD